MTEYHIIGQSKKTIENGRIVDTTLFMKREIMSVVRTHVIVRRMGQGVYFRKDGGVGAIFERHNVPGAKYL